MSFNPRRSNEEVISSASRYTGLCNQKVVAINPNMEELKKLGINATKEPEYNVTFTDKNTTEERTSYRLDFYLRNKVLIDTDGIKKEHDIRAKVGIFLEDKIARNRDANKVLWTNKFGQIAWSPNEETVPDYTWFRSEGARPIIVGEDILIDFLANWANVGSEDQACLDNPGLITKGNLSEIKGLYSMIPNNEIQVLLGIKYVQGKLYQDVYTGRFDRPYRKAYDQWKKALENQFSKFKSDWGNSFTLKVFTPSPDMQSDSPSNLDQGGTVAPGSAAAMDF